MKGGEGGGGTTNKGYGSDDPRRSPSLWSILCGHSHRNGKPFSKDAKASASSFKVLLLFLLLFLFIVYLFYPLHAFLTSFSHISCITDTAAAANDNPTEDTTTVEVARSVLQNQGLADGVRNTSVLAVEESATTPPPADEKRAVKVAVAVAVEKEPTGLQHIVFGIAASAKLWNQRKDYLKLWWRPRKMRGYVWLERPVREMKSRRNHDLPVLKISSNTSDFPYTHRQGHRSAIRISRIISETFRLGLPNVRWFVMGDDDTVFLPDNLAGVLRHFDHRQPYYIGSLSESHLQNIYFSYGMAYGGGGFAISRPLAAMLVGIQDRCIKRYPALYGSDDRIQACMAELGVPLTRHPGFHQYDVYGDLLGLLASHPVAPLVTLHHLDVVRPIFPDAPSRAAALRRLFDGPVRLDSAGVMQQSICYDVERSIERQWTVSVAWGFAVLMVRGVISPREMETPARTFLNWYRRADYTAYAFNTRPVARNPCQKPFVYYLASSRYDAAYRTIVTTYELHREKHPPCKWRMTAPGDLIDRIVVYKKPDPGLWDRSPRRNCCRVLSSPKRAKRNDSRMVIDVGICRQGEITEA